MEIPSTSFLFCVCQAGAEGVLKREIAREHPDLRAAYARPGLVTFKHLAARIAPDFPLRSVFARAWGASLPAATGAALPRFARRLHVFERDAWRPGEAPPSITHGAAARAVRAEILAAAGTHFLADERARPGEIVLDVIVDPGGEDPLFLGCHLHRRGRVPWPGGRPPIEIPAEAPSRAYAKLEEAIAWSAAPIAAGQTAVEIGSAPGGASYALVRRGLNVVGVDPGDMDPIVERDPRFSHVRRTMADVRRSELPARVDWLLLDVNLAPQVALHMVRRLVAAFRPTLRGVLFTLKLNEWRFAAEIPDLVRRVEAMGVRHVRATQLPSNRQEICLYGELPRRIMRRTR